VYSGKLNSVIEENLITFTDINIVESELETGTVNLIMDPKLISNKNEVKAFGLKQFETCYKNIKHFKHTNTPHNASNYMNGLISTHLTFSREKSLENTNNIHGKIFCIFPNVNLELKQIKSISLSSTELTKYLVGKAKDLPKEINSNICQNGFLAMSQQHRLITLLDDYNGNDFQSSKCAKQILFGVWINLREERINSKTVTNEKLDGLIQKYKMRIYQKCLNYILKTAKIETVNSPCPDEGVFLIVLFYRGMQCYYEVKILPNEEDKYFHGNGPELSKFSNNWIIISKDVILNKDHLEVNFKEIEKSSQNIKYKLMEVPKFLNKKYSANSDNIDSQSNKNSDVTRSTRVNKNFKDPLNELFENDEDGEISYDLPFSLSPNQNRKIGLKNGNGNMNQKDNPKNNLEKNLQNNKMFFINSNLKRCTDEESESLTISSSKGTSVKSIPLQKASSSEIHKVLNRTPIIASKEPKPFCNVSNNITLLIISIKNL
jgi:hypothetical protein